MDRHRLWRVVGRNYEILSEVAPKGYVPVIEAFIADRPEPVRVARVETSRDPEFGWTFLVSEVGDESGPTPDDCLVLVPEQYVERVEMRYERSESRGIGFTHDELKD